MSSFVQVAEAGLWFLGEWSLRWGVLIGLVAIWFYVRAPRRSDVRYAIAFSVLLAGLCLPLVPNWGPGFWPGDAGLLSSTTTGEPTREVSASDAVIPESVAPAMSPLTYPPGYTGSPVEPDAARAQSIAAAAPIPDEAVPPVEATVVTTAVPQSPTSRTASNFEWSYPATLVIAYGVGVAVMLGRLLLGLIYLKRLRHAAVEGAAAVVELFDGCCRELDVRRAELRVHPHVVSPIVCGLFRPCVIVPPDFGELSRPTQHACLTHELTHVRRRDSWAALLTESVRVLFFFHPLVHWLAARLNLEREYICDEAALRVETDQRRYAADLLSFGRRGVLLRFSDHTSVSMPFGRRSTVKARVARLLATGAFVPSSSPRRQFLIALCLVLICGALGALRVEAMADRNSEPIETETVTAAEEAAPDRIDDSNDDSTAEAPARPQIRVKYTPEDGPGYGIEYHPVTIAGTALDSAGQPVVGATVWLAAGVVTVFTECPETRTDADGRFTFVDVDVEVHRHRDGPVPKPTEADFTVFGAATDYGFTWHSQRNYRPYERPDGTDPADTDAATTERAFYVDEPMDVTLQFEPPAVVRGRVTDDAGKPIANASVQVGHVNDTRNPDGFGMYRCTYLAAEGSAERDVFAAISALPETLRATRTDANGFYELMHLRRDTEYTALIDAGPEYDPLGLEFVTQEGESDRNTKYLGYDGDFDASCPAPRNVDVRVVAAESGEPLEGVTLLAHGRRVRRAGGSARSDQNGLATLRLVPGDYKLYVEPSSVHDFLGTLQELSVAADTDSEPRQIALEQAAVVVLQVVDAATGEPVAGASFEYETDTTRVRETLHSQTRYADAPLTNPQGELRAVVEPGRKRFVCVANRIPTDEPVIVGDLIDLQPGTTTTLRFEMSRTPVSDDASDLEDEFLRKLAAVSRFQQELQSTLRARLSVSHAFAGVTVPFAELQMALNELDPNEIPDVETLMPERLDQSFEIPRMDITVDGWRRRGDFHYLHPRTGRTSTSVDVITESVSLFYNPENAQADAFDRQTGRRSSHASFQLCNWPQIRDESADFISVQDGRAVFEMESGNRLGRMVLDHETGFLYRSLNHQSASSSGRAEWQFAPRTLANGLILPGLKIKVNYRDGQTFRVEFHRFDEVELVEEFPPSAFAIALPPGVNVLDWRDVPQDGPRRPDAGVVTGPVSDMLAYLDRRESRRRSIEPVVEYGTPAPALQIAHWLNADGATSAPELDGKVVLIDFWGITCGFCVAQLDDVRAAHKHLAGDDFLLIGVHDADGTVEEVAAFARERNLDYQLAIDNEASAEGWFGATTQAFGVRGIPQAAVFDRGGNIVYLGQFDQALVHVERAMAERAE